MAPGIYTAESHGPRSNGTLKVSCFPLAPVVFRVYVIVFSGVTVYKSGSRTEEPDALRFWGLTFWSWRHTKRPTSSEQNDSAVLGGGKTVIRRSQKGRSARRASKNIQECWSAPFCFLFLLFLLFLSVALLFLIRAFTKHIQKQQFCSINHLSV